VVRWMTWLHTQRVYVSGSCASRGGGFVAAHCRVHNVCLPL